MLKTALWPDNVWYILHAYISVHYTHTEMLIGGLRTVTPVAIGLSTGRTCILTLPMLKNYCSWSSTWCLNPLNCKEGVTGESVVQSSEELGAKFGGAEGNGEKKPSWFPYSVPKIEQPPSSIKSPGQIIVMILISLTPVLLSDSFSGSRLVPNLGCPCLTLKHLKR